MKRLKIPVTMQADLYEKWKDPLNEAMDTRGIVKKMLDIVRDPEDFVRAYFAERGSSSVRDVADELEDLGKELQGEGKKMQESEEHQLEEGLLGDLVSGAYKIAGHTLKLLAKTFWKGVELLLSKWITKHPIARLFIAMFFLAAGAKPMITLAKFFFTLPAWLPFSIYAFAAAWVCFEGARLLLMINQNEVKNWLDEKKAPDVSWRDYTRLTAFQH